MDRIDQFLSHISLELGYSSLTVDAYSRDLRQWAEYATGGAPESLVPEDVTFSDLRLWVAHLAETGCSPRTIKRKVSALRAFFRHMLRQGAIAYNPASRLSLPKPSKMLPVNVRPEETSAILDAAVPDDDFSAVRDRLILDILYSTGMRCSELIGLKDADVDTVKGELKVLGKRDLVSRMTQIVGVCDEFDELICGVGKARVRVHEAINNIRNYSGIWYDSDIVSAFLQLIAVYPVGSRVKTNKGELGIVMRQNPHFPERPVLRIIEDKYGQAIHAEIIVDLIKDTSVVIQQVIK